MNTESVEKKVLPLSISAIIAVLLFAIVGTYNFSEIKASYTKSDLELNSRLSLMEQRTELQQKSLDSFKEETNKKLDSIIDLLLKRK